jgi:uncharacterized protein
VRPCSTRIPRTERRSGEVAPYRAPFERAHNGGVATDPFDVALGDLRDHRRERHVVRRGTIRDALVADVDSRVPAGAEAAADVELQGFEGGVAVVGVVSSMWEGECRRCLRPVSGALETTVREMFRRGGGDEDGTYPMTADHLNLREMVLDSLFCALPILPLCRDDCAGTCSGCGADLNTVSCGCATVTRDPRWLALDALDLGEAGEDGLG